MSTPTSDTTGRVALLVEGSAVVTIRVDNPPVNTLTMSVLGDLRAAIERVEGMPDARCVVIEAAGRTFIAGGDVGELLDTVGDSAGIEEHVGLTADLFGRLQSLPIPVIAAVDGPAVGGGLELLLRCDLTVATSTARFGLPEAKLGLIPGAGGTQLLARRCGEIFAARLLFTAALVGAHEALQAGLVTEVVDGLARERAHEIATRIAGLPTGAVRAAKTALRGGLDGPLADGLALERRLFSGLLLEQATAERLRDFLAR